jgi:hypothetical protein
LKTHSNVSQYYVYVIELDRALCERRGCTARNGKPPVYVGQSVIPPAVRFEQHKRGHKASRIVRRYGLRLRPHLSTGHGPYDTRQEALDGEAAVADALVHQGYCVHGGH